MLFPETNTDEIMKEVTAMMKLRHPQLLHLYAVCMKEKPIWIITELMVNGSLENFLKNGKLISMN